MRPTIGSSTESPARTRHLEGAVEQHRPLPQRYERTIVGPVHPSNDLTSVVGFSVPIASLRVWPGSPYPLGATWDGVGVNFALFSEHATRVELCLFDSATAEVRVGHHPAARTDRHGLARLSAGRAARAAVWLSRARPVRAARRASLQPEQARCSIRTRARSDGRCAGTKRSSASRSAQDDTTLDDRDSAAYAPLAAVVDNAFTWGDDRPPRTPWHETLIYELHVKGFTKLNPADPRGAARHLSRPCVGAVDPSPEVARRHRGGADAGASARRRLAPRAARPGQLLGLQHARLLRAGRRATRRRSRRSMPSASSR